MQLAPIYSCDNQAQVQPGKFPGDWNDGVIDFYIGEQHAQIFTHGKKAPKPSPVFILIFPEKVLVYDSSKIPND